LLATCLVLAVKFNEEYCHFNASGRRFFWDTDFAPVVSIPKSVLIDFQFHILTVLDNKLFISEETYLRNVTMMS
jgi:hypothetical protein